jgi:Na+-driven multidrug efflux pump
MARRFVKYSSPVVVNEAAWGLGTSLLTVILGYTTNSVEMLAANAVIGNLSRLFLMVCFGLGAATAVTVGRTIGEGKSHEEVQDLSRVLLRFASLVGAGIAAVSLLLVPTLFVPVIFPLFKLYGASAAIATSMAAVNFGTIPIQAYAISSVTGVLRSGGDTLVSSIMDLGSQWLLGIPLTALCALVLQTGPWPIALAMQAENMLKAPLCMWRMRTDRWIHDVTRPDF